MEKQIKVVDMSCQHCVKRIEKALAEAKIEARVDLETKSVYHQADEQAVVAVIESSGYHVE